MSTVTVSKSAAADWRRFRSKALRSRYGREDACLDLPPTPLSLLLGEAKPKRLIYITKGAFFRNWSRFVSLPGDLALGHQGGIPSRTYCEALKRYGEWLKTPLLFVGDLDPLDLTIFAALLSGSPDLRRSATTSLSLAYIGIDDRWLHLCKEYLPRAAGGLNAITIRMGATERKHFDVVRRILPGIEQLIGPECLRLLSSGRKLELEGAGHPGLYRKGFRQQLSSLLLERVRRGH